MGHYKQNGQLYIILVPLGAKIFPFKVRLVLKGRNLEQIIVSDITKSWAERGLDYHSIQLLH